MTIFHTDFITDPRTDAFVRGIAAGKAELAPEIERMRAALAIHFNAGLGVVNGEETMKMDRAYVTRQMLRQQVKSLRGFSRAVLECWPDGDVDGGTLQDLAIQYGLLEPQTKTAPCSEESCRCAEYYGSDEWADGITCYRRTALVLGA